MYRISVDGACKLNGKPDCMSAGGIFVQNLEDPSETHIGGIVDYNSTNQRGELYAMMLALDFAIDAREDCRIVTDSEYMFNSITKGWYDKWRHNNWRGSTGDIIKNQDLWASITAKLDYLYDNSIEMDFFHVKGHVIPFGVVGAKQLLIADGSGYMLQQAMLDKFDEVEHTRSVEKINHAEEVFLKNNGCTPPRDVLREFVVANCVADTVATHYVEEAFAKV